MRHVLNALTIKLLFACAAFSAGLEVTFESKDLTKQEAPVTSTMYVSGNKIAMEIFTGERTMSMIYRGDKQLVWTVNHEKKEVMEITRASMDQLGSAMNSAMAQMKRQMANMTPQQREMMENMMKGAMGGPAGTGMVEAPIAFKKTNEKKTISKYACIKYDVVQGTEKTREMWVSDWKAAKDLSAAAPAFESLADFFKGMLDAFKGNPVSKQVDNPFSHAKEINGFPVMTVEYASGAATRETTLRKVSKITPAESYFNPPAGYTVTNPGMGQKRDK